MAWVRIASVIVVVRVGGSGRRRGVVEDDDLVDGEDGERASDAAYYGCLQLCSRETGCGD